MGCWPGISDPSWAVACSHSPTLLLQGTAPFITRVFVETPNTHPHEPGCSGPGFPRPGPYHLKPWTWLVLLLPPRLPHTSPYVPGGAIHLTEPFGPQEVDHCVSGPPSLFAKERLRPWAQPQPPLALAKNWLRVPCPFSPTIFSYSHLLLVRKSKVELNIPPSRKEE
jgi:hypothetical protein